MGCIDKTQEWKRVFVSIMTSNILSLISAVLSIAIIITEETIVEMILSIMVYSFSLMILMLILMISKRTFIIYCNSIDGKKGKKG